MPTLSIHRVQRNELTMTQLPGNEPLSYADYGDIPPVAPRARLVRIPMILTLIFSGILAPLFAFLMVPLEEMSRNPGAAPNAGVMGGALALVCTSCLQFIAFVLTAVFYCMWIYRASSVARRLSPDLIRYAPGWAVGWYFIPFANLVMPFLVMREIWQVARQPEPASDMPVALWWGLYVVSGLISSAGSIAGSDLIKAHMAQAVLQCISVVFMIVSGILCLRIVRQVTEGLDSQAGHLPPPSPSAPPEPSIFP
jgi:hypothetical protein